MPSSNPGTDLPNPGIESRSPALWADCLLTEPPGKPQHTGLGSLSLLQGLFLTQELNQGLLHCIEPGSSALQVDSLPTELSGKPNTLAT